MLGYHVGKERLEIHTTVILRRDTNELVFAQLKNCSFT